MTLDEQMAALPPYALSMGMFVERIEDGAPVLALDFSERVLGRPGFVHGGAISGLLEMAAIAALRAELARRGNSARIKPVNVSIEFMRGAGLGRTFALGRVTRAGRRIANLSATAWQDNPAKPVASAWMNVLLAE